MPTKTDRILSYLPGTFQTTGRPPALYAVVDGFGNELQLAENSLAAVMLAHWVDFADKNADFIQDLNSLAALYGLAPRDDESVEEFRDHLKRYVRTFLDGTVTVQGILRVTAEALGLRIADSYDDLDSWWKRPAEELVTVEQRSDDAASLLFGSPALQAGGKAAQSALITGPVNPTGAGLQGASMLRLSIDGGAAQEIQLAAGPIILKDVVDAINTKIGITVARVAGQHLDLASPTAGPSSRLQIPDGPSDAAPLLLGLAPRVYHGSEADAARIIGLVDLAGGVDLSQERYLRINVDGKRLAEVDCADPAAPLTNLDFVRDAINNALGPVASHDAHHLMLTSPAKGFKSVIALQPAAAQDARSRLFGPVGGFATGHDAQPARVTGSRDLSGGVDLAERSNIRLKIDGVSKTINCAGFDPAHTQVFEIVTAINTAFKAQTAGPDGPAISVSSSTIGSAGEVSLEVPDSGDATDDIFGIGPRTFQGAAASQASVPGTLDLSGGVDLMARHSLSLAVDGGPPAEIDLRSRAANPRAVTPQNLADAINQGIGREIVSTDGKRLILTSPTQGSVSKIEIAPLERARRRSFVTRALVTDEATQAVFGFVVKDAQGTAATNAQLIGSVDLSNGVDLRDAARFLRVSMDGSKPVDVDCSGSRPRATLLSEIVQKINAAVPNATSDDGKHLILTSAATGAGSRIVLDPRASDALDSLLGVQPGTTRGQDPTRVSFSSTVDITGGIDLPAHAAVKIGVDATDPVEVDLAGPAPVHLAAIEVASAINLALKSRVCTIGANGLILNSSARGADSKIEFAVPAGTDATASIFGVKAPRKYRGSGSRPAQVAGKPDLSALKATRFLRLAVDGDPAKNVDCAVLAGDPPTVAGIVKSINTALGKEIASTDGTILTLTSPILGSTGQIALQPFTSGDAREKLFGKDSQAETEGADPAPATIVGDKQLLDPVDVSSRRLIRVSVDGARPVDIDVAGADPTKTSLAEIVAAINRVFPQMASATDDGRLRISALNAAQGSRLSLLPFRYLELVEYPPAIVDDPPRTVQSGSRWRVDNGGVADSSAQFSILAPSGATDPALVNLTLGRSVRLLTHLNAGDTARLWRNGDGAIRAEIVSSKGIVRKVAPSQILAGPLGSQAVGPFPGAWNLTASGGHQSTLQLNNPLSPRVVVLRARQQDAATAVVSVTAAECDLSKAAPPSIIPGGTTRVTGRVRADADAFHIVDTAGKILFQLQPGPHADLNAYRDRVASIAGSVHWASPPLVVVESIAACFDVTVVSGSTPETYLGVTIGEGAGPDSLIEQIHAGKQFGQLSTLVKAYEMEKGDALVLPPGVSDWMYLNCFGSRYNQARFNRARFPGAACRELGVFNVSRFANTPPEPIASVYCASKPDPQAPPAGVVVSLRRLAHLPGVFNVNLPVDLPERFGARFNQARFAVADQGTELYPKIVFEPSSDPNYIVSQIEGKPSHFVKAVAAPGSAPIGWLPVTLPFRKPQFLTLGGDGAPARIYLREEGVEGVVQLTARAPGAWGNAIAVTARKSGPAMYDLTVSYQGARFENARATVRGRDLPALIAPLLQPGPAGVLQAKAAGVLALVSRDRTEPDSQSGVNNNQI